MYREITPSEWIIYVDGASRGNPGKSGVGFFIKKNGTVCYSAGYYIGTATNNQAEYLAAIAALKYISTLEPREGKNIIIFADSLLLVKQIQGLYRVKNPILQKLHAEIAILLKNFTWNAYHITRDKNTYADELANKSIEHETPPPPFLLPYLTVL